MPTPYESIRQLVIEQYETRGGMPPYETLTALVREHFPHSKWKETHYAWYKSQIRTGRISVARVRDADGIEYRTNAGRIVRWRQVTEVRILK